MSAERRGSKPGERRGGRKPGTPNKGSLRARDALDAVNRRYRMKWDPLEWAAAVASGKEGDATMAERIAAADKLIRRLYPELRALEVSGDAKAPIPVVISKAILDL